MKLNTPGRPPKTPFADRFADREIPVEHRNRLNHLCSFEQETRLTPKLLDSYWKVRSTVERSGGAVSSDHLVLASILSGLVQPPPMAEEPFSGDPPKPHAPLIVKWRGEEVEAIYIHIQGKDVVVEIEGERRVLHHSKVRKK